jgi:hypothetical protein
VTWDERLHWLGGWFYGLLARQLPPTEKIYRALEIRDWAFMREQQQNQLGQDVNEHLSEKQIAEAYAWEDGFRRGARMERRDVA